MTKIMSEFDFQSMISRQQHDVGFMDPEIARDLGIVPIEDAYDVIQDVMANGPVKIDDLQRHTPENATKRTAIDGYLGAQACADCAVEVAPGTTCFGGHMTVSARGKTRLNGY